MKNYHIFKLASPFKNTMLKINYMGNYITEQKCKLLPLFSIIFCPKKYIIRKQLWMYLKIYKVIPGNSTYSTEKSMPCYSRGTKIKVGAENCNLESARLCKQLLFQIITTLQQSYLPFLNLPYFQKKQKILTIFKSQALTAKLTFKIL